MKYFDLRSLDGRVSSLGVSSEYPKLVRIVGVIPHGNEYDLQELLRFAYELIDYGKKVDDESK
jgi:hypothetical protein